MQHAILPSPVYIIQTPMTKYCDLITPLFTSLVLNCWCFAPKHYFMSLSGTPWYLLAPTGALIVVTMVFYYISAAAAAATFSDFHSVHWRNWCYKSHSKSLKQYQCNWYHKMSWGYLWDILGNFRDIMGIFWGYFGNILGIFWGYFENILGIFWRYFGDILGIF